MRPLLLFLVFFLALRVSIFSSSNPEALIRRFGDYASPSGKLSLKVTRRSTSLVDFKVLDAVTGKMLVSDYVGSDAMRWFLWWETPEKLWGYGSDIGYFKAFEFTATGVKETKISRETELPKMVWENLPTVLQKRYKVRGE